MKIKRLLLPALAVLTVATGVAFGAGGIQAQSHECTVCPAQQQATPPTPAGPETEFRFVNTSPAERSHVFRAVSDPERACVTQTVSADLEAAVYVDVESIEPSAAPWEPVPDELVYRETGVATMQVETCVVMFGTARVAIGGN